MAPPRKKKRTPSEWHSVHLRLPPDVFQWVEAQAKKEERPFNRAVIDALAAIPALEKQRTQEDILEDMRNTLARYSARVVLADLGEPLLDAVDKVLDAPSDSELKRRLDKLRVLRSAMLKNERESKF
jgi:hypothetical protein